MKRWLSAIGLILVLASCDKEAPSEVRTASVQFTAVDASCTEVLLQVKMLAGVPQRTVRVQRDSTTIFNTTITAAETLIVDRGLLPNTRYDYNLSLQSGVTEEQFVSSITTLDTTSHAITWQWDTLGVTSSALYDVAIVNDTLAYAAGEMYLRDSSGQLDPTPYNVARWNGTAWTSIRIQFYSICGQASRTPYPANSVFVFGATSVWFAMRGDQVAVWDGNRQTATMCLPVSFRINKLWGENQNSVYAVGNGGNIMHFNGSSWQQLGSGTNVKLNDVWGGSNRWAGENVVLVAASNKFTAGDIRLIRINEREEVDSLPWPMQDRTINSIWFDQHSRIFTSGGGVFCSRDIGTWSEQPVPPIYTNCIRGNGQNDVWVVGDFGIVGHFNGITWQTYPEVSSGGRNYKSVAVKGNKIIAVGSVGNRAFILRGSR